MSGRVPEQPLLSRYALLGDFAPCLGTELGCIPYIRVQVVHQLLEGVLDQLTFKRQKRISNGFPNFGALVRSKFEDALQSLFGGLAP